MAIEIELKFQFASRDDSDTFEQWLQANAQHQSSLQHREFYLDNPRTSTKFTNRDGLTESTDFLRVRFTESGDSVCLKRFTVDPNSYKAQNLFEHETAVADGETMLELLKSLGYTDVTAVNKTRDTYTYQNFEISVDQVEGLGRFVEVELLEHADDWDAGYKQIYQLLREIGLKQVQQQSRGYVSMLWNPTHDFGNVKELG